VVNSSPKCAVKNPSEHAKNDGNNNKNIIYCAAENDGKMPPVEYISAR